MDFSIKILILGVFIIHQVQSDFLKEFSYPEKSSTRNGNSNLEIEKLLKDLRSRRSSFSGFGNYNDTEQGLEMEPESGEDKFLNELRNEIRQRFAHFKHQIEVVHGLGSSSSREDEHDVDGTLDPEIEVHSSGSRQRKRRAVITADNQLPGRRRRNITHYESAGIHVVRQVFPLNPQPFTYKKLIDLNILSIKGEFYAFSLEQEGGTTNTYTCVYKIDKGLTPREILREPTPNAVSIDVIQIEQSYYVLPLEYNKTTSADSGSTLYSFEPTKRTLYKKQTIVTENTKSMHFWVGLGKEANDVFLAIAPEYVTNTKSTGVSYNYKVEIPIYRWQGAYFDYIHSIPAYCPQSIQYALVKSAGFLAIANYQDDSQSTSIYSEIFKYNYKESKYLSFQKILTRGAKDMQFFNFTNGVQDDYYLAIANNCEKDKYGTINYQVKSHILKYGEGRFVPFQSFNTYGAYQILPVKTDDKTFLVIGEISGIRIIQYNGWRFTETYSYKYSSAYSYGIGSLKLRSFLYDSQPYFSLASTAQNIEGGIYSVVFDQKNAYKDMTTDFESACYKALNTIEQENAGRLVEKVIAAPKVTDTEIRLASSLTFSDGLIAESLVAKTLQYNGILFDEKLSKNLKDRETRLKSLEKELEELVQKLSQVVLRDENREINTEIEFTNIDYYGSELVSEYVKTDRLNGIRLVDLFSKLIYLDKDYKFVEISIDQLITSQNIKVERLNGYALSDFALKSSEYQQLFTNENSFLETVTAQNGFQTFGLVDGIDFNNIDFLLKDRNQTFQGPIIIRDSTVNNLVSSIVNNVDLQYYINEAVSRNGLETITGNKEFQIVKISQLDAETISGYNIKELYEQAVRINGKYLQSFEGSETKFEELTVSALTLSQDKINDRYEMNDFLSISNGDHYLDQIELQSDTSIEELYVNRSLNQINVYDGQLDLILKNSGTKQLIGNKKIENIVLEKDSYALGLIDGVNLTGWSNEKEIELEEDRITFSNFQTTGYLKVPSVHVGPYSRFYLSNSDVTKLLSSSLTLDAKELPSNFRGSIIFNSVYVEDNTEIRSINRFYPRNWLTTEESYENSAKIVTGKKTFTGDIKLGASSTATGLYASTDRKSENILNGFGDLLIDGEDQTVLKSTVFDGLLTIENLDCPGIVLNGIEFKNLLTTTGDQEVYGNVVFKEPITVTNKFLVNGDIQTVSLNGYNLDTLIGDTLKYSSPFPQTFTGNVVINDKLTATDFETMEGSKVGGYNLTELLGNIISSRSSGAKRIDGKLIFTSESSVEQLQITGSSTINGIDSAEWGKGLLLSSENQVITTPVTFRGSISADNITVINGKVSNLNIIELARDIVRIDTDSSLGVIFFENTLRSENGDITVGGEVNGFNLDKDLLLSNARGYFQEISGKKTFENVLYIDGDLEVKTLNDFKHYSQAGSFAYAKNSESDSLKINGNLNLKNEIEFTKLFNYENWNEVLASIWFADESIDLPKSVEFKSIVLQNGGQLDGTLNGNIQLNELIQEYIRKEGDNVLTGKWKIDSYTPVAFKDLTVSDGIILQNNGKINNINLNEFRTSVLLDGVDQRIENRLKFEELIVREIDLEEGGRVGGWDLNKELVTEHGENVISGSKVIENLSATNSLILGEGTTINQINLQQWYEDAVKLNGDQTIKGSLEFSEATFNRGLTVDGYLDQVKFDEYNILTLTTDQVINGKITFNQDREYEAGSFIAQNGFNVEGYFNGYSLSETIGNLIYKNNENEYEPIIVYGDKEFTSSILMESLKAEGLYQGYNISSTMSNLIPENYLTGHYNYSLEERYKYMSELATKLHRIADKRSIFLAYYEETSRITEVNGIAGIKTYNIRDQSLLCISKKTESSHSIAWWSYGLEVDSYLQGLMSDSIFYGELNDYVPIEYESNYYIIATVSSIGNQAVSINSETQLVKGRFGEIDKSSDKLSKAYVLKLIQGESSSFGSLVVYQIIYGYAFGRVLTFTLPESKEACALINVYEKTEGSGTIYCLDSLSLSFRHSQTLKLNQPTFSATVTTMDTTFLMIANGGRTTDSGRGGGLIDVYSRSTGERSFKKIDCIPTVNLISMDTIYQNNNQVLLATASGKISRFSGGVYIYRYSTEIRKFEKIQILSVKSPVKIRFQTFLSLSSEVLLHIMTKENVYVYTYQGLSGFHLSHTLSIESSSFDFEASSFLTSTDQVFKSQLITTSENNLQIYTAALNGI